MATLAAAFDSVLVRPASAREDQRRLLQDANRARLGGGAEIGFTL